MAITPYTVDGKTFYKIRVQLKSPRNPSIRVSRQLSGFRSVNEAEKAEQRLYRETRDEVADLEHQGACWLEVLDAWRIYQLSVRVPLGEISKPAVEDYYGSLRRWMARFDQTPCSRIGALDLKELFIDMGKEGISVTHQGKLKSVIKWVFEYGIHKHMIPFVSRSPTADVQLRKQEDKKPELLTGSEALKLIELAFAKQHEWRYVWAFALLTGMRSGELFALEWTDIDWENQVVSVTKSFSTKLMVVKSTKAARWRDIPINDDLLKLLRALRPMTGETPNVLPRLKAWRNSEQAAILRQFCEENGITSIKFHTLRAWFATQLLRTGVDLLTVQKVGGWEDLETMQYYVRLAGIGIKGATDTLSVLPSTGGFAKVVSIAAEGA